MESPAAMADQASADVGRSSSSSPSMRIASWTTWTPSAERRDASSLEPGDGVPHRLLARVARLPRLGLGALALLLRRERLAVAPRVGAAPLRAGRLARRRELPLVV